MEEGIREKGMDLTVVLRQKPLYQQKFKKAKWQHKNATKNFDYTTHADRLRKVSWTPYWCG